MHLHSLGYQTDLIFARFAGEVLDRGNYLVIRTRSNPTYFWGNFLIFPNPPQEEDFARWRELFATEIGTPPAVNHFAFGWDNTAEASGNCAPFLAAGFALEESIVLTARHVQRPPKANSAVEVRVLTTDAEWEQAIQCQIQGRSPDFSLEGYTVFMRAKMAAYRAMTQQGLGHWFGAFVEGAFAGDLGVFVDRGVGRFQSVETHPDFQRRGVCSMLVYHAAQTALTTLGAQVLVMVADEHYHATRIYESIGFQPTERQAGLQWFLKQA